MAAIARGNGADTVFSFTGTGVDCLSPITTATDVCSGDVFINGEGAVREGDQVAPHPAAGCGNDSSVVTSFSSTVKVNGRGVARIGDEYTSDNIITSGSGTVSAGG